MADPSEPGTDWPVNRILNHLDKPPRPSETERLEKALRKARAEGNAKAVRRLESLLGLRDTDTVTPAPRRKKRRK